MVTAHAALAPEKTQVPPNSQPWHMKHATLAESEGIAALSFKTSKLSPNALKKTISQASLERLRSAGWVLGTGGREIDNTLVA